jgi:hypothetical protein
MVIDPMLSPRAWKADGNQDDAQLGNSVGTAGDVNGDGFDDVIVGAWLFDNGRVDEGRALVYHGSVRGLRSTPAWSAESDQDGAHFGHSVGTAGDVNGDGYDDVIVGVSSFGREEGLAIVYQGSASGLSSTPVWNARGDQVGADFGSSVGTAGDVNGDGYDDVIVGASGYSNDQTDEGRTFVYLGSASGLDTTPVWTAEGDQDVSYFGRSVGTAGDVNGDGFHDVIVGAPWFNNGQFDEGRASVYHGSPSGLANRPAWTTEGNQVDALLGWSVGTAADVNGDGFDDVIVGAEGYDNGEMDEGRAYVYHGSASGLTSTPAWTAEGDQEGAGFGTSVGTAADVNGDGFDDVIVGAEAYRHGQSFEGLAFTYEGSDSGLLAMPSQRLEGNQPFAHFGRSVRMAGDVNGDGFGEVIVGAFVYDNGETDEGAAFVFMGRAIGLGIPGRT